jgi:hypothetical protein
VFPIAQLQVINAPTWCLSQAGQVTGTALAAKPHYTLAGRVVAIADGDNLTVSDTSNRQHKIRLAGIDAPEKTNASSTVFSSKASRPSDCPPSSRAAEKLLTRSRSGPILAFVIPSIAATWLTDRSKRTAGRAMQFAVRATTSAGTKVWLAALNGKGVRSLGTQVQAQIFTSRDDARLAIAELPGDFVAAGMRFSVEPLDTDARIDCQG